MQLYRGHYNQWRCVESENHYSLLIYGQKMNLELEESLE